MPTEILPFYQFVTAPIFLCLPFGKSIHFLHTFVLGGIISMDQSSSVDVRFCLFHYFSAVSILTFTYYLLTLYLIGIYC